MTTPAPDAVKRLVDHFDLGRKVFLSGDYKEEQLRAEFLNGPSLSIRHSDLASAAPVGQRIVRTSPGPFFTALVRDVSDRAGWVEVCDLDALSGRAGVMDLRAIGGDGAKPSIETSI